MLLLKEQGYGYKRIANHLNNREIPSPAAGSQRRENGKIHANDGLWCASTVKSLLENRVILAIFDYGVRSEGKHRRLGAAGPRFLDESDRNSDRREKVIKNDPTLWISKRLPFEPKFDPDRWKSIMEETRRRGNSQRGVPRSRDASKYPLSCLVVDLSDHCGALMYGRTSGKRRVYNCGKYMKSGGAACENNQVDAEALLEFVLRTLAELVDRMGAREELEARLLQRAREASAHSGQPALNTLQLDNRLRELRHKKDLASRNAALAEDQELRAEAERLFVRFREELRQVELELRQLQSVAASEFDPREEVANALAILDDIQRVARDSAARAEIPGLLKRLGLRVGLRFEGAIKGKRRRVRRLAGGTIVFGKAKFEEEIDRASNKQPPAQRMTKAEELEAVLESPASASGPSPR